MKKKKFVRDEWRVLSDKFVRHHRLPYGTKLILEHRSTTGSKNGRRARNDMTFSRRLFQGRADNDETLADLFNRYLLPSLIINPNDKGLRIKLIGPNGEEPKSTNTKVRTIRQYSPLPTPDEIEAGELREAEIEEIAKFADMTIREIEEHRSDSEMVLRGIVRALIQRYGGEAVSEAVAGELAY